MVCNAFWPEDHTWVNFQNSLKIRRSRDPVLQRSTHEAVACPEEPPLVHGYLTQVSYWAGAMGSDHTASTW